MRITLVGDEFHHCLMTDKGVAVRFDSVTGYYTPIEASVLNQSLERASQLRRQANEVREARLARGAQRVTSAKDVGAPKSIVGNKKGLVILVSFSDTKIKSTNQQFWDMFNKEGYNLNNHKGSVRDYFRDQSYGKLNIDFDVVGPVQLTKASTYYGKDTSTGQDVNAPLMVQEACKAVKDSVNYKDYDWDGDGEVDQVFIIFAGYGSHYQGANANWIWPAEWNLSSARYYYSNISGPLTLDGVKVDTYAYAPEMAYTSGSTRNGIGTACHEFSHCLGLPDAYDTNYNLCPSMFDWDLMDSGSYNGANGLGECPSGLSAYERWESGWLDFVELNKPEVITDMPCLLDSACAYIIYNQGNRSEAYILENRQNKKWFSYPSGAHGMLIYHVDYDANTWYMNNVNSSKNHPRMFIVPASNVYGTPYSSEGVYSVSDAQYKAHTWPGTTKQHSFTDTTTPAATLYNTNSDGTKFLGRPVEDIAEKNSLISFVFNGGVTLDVPSFTECEHLDSTSVMLNWSPVTNASSYDLRILRMPVGQMSVTYLNESLDAFIAASDGTTSLSTSMDKYTTLPGWSAKYIYKGVSGAKIGSSKNKGHLTTPVLPLEGAVSFTVTLTPYGTDDKNITIALCDTLGKVEQSYTLTADGKPQTVTFAEVHGSYKIKIEPTQRVYAKDLLVESASTKSETLIKNIQEVTYSLSGLDPYSNYEFQIRACSKYNVTEWSEAYLIEAYEEETGIEDIHVVNPRSESVCYDLTGRPVRAGQGWQIHNGKVKIQF